MILINDMDLKMHFYARIVWFHANFIGLLNDFSYIKLVDIINVNLLGCCFSERSRAK
ncbi:hypothetical protein Vspart_00955 [Vibrio spartinae]|uniref:Uncharacterized protein n=1 Tax=Vibrio spartinae TaxID=1918945 RepID=A0A1N6M8E3_9VIBR|nr:hypothetical protein Vspart_00955 [Vibrio spartinae]SIO95630.1 hypothetical protein VSP9026_03378 [Vibrio spartinae]